MKQYNTNQKKKIVLIINEAKNKIVQALKFNISIRTYYWKKKISKYVLLILKLFKFNYSILFCYI